MLQPCLGVRSKNWEPRTHGLPLISKPAESHQSQLLNTLLVKGYLLPIHCQSRAIESPFMEGLLNPIQTKVIEYPASQGLLSLHPVWGFEIESISSQRLLNLHPVKGY